MSSSSSKVKKLTRRQRIKRGLAATKAARLNSDPYTHNTGGRNSDEYPLTELCLNKGIDQMFPDRFCVKMKNSFIVTFLGTGGATYGFAFTANGLHNPLSNVVTGANPISGGSATSIYGLGNLLTIGLNTGPYLNYRILDAAVKIELGSYQASSGVEGTLVVIPMTTTAATNLGNVSTWSALDWREQPYAKWKSLSGQGINQFPTMQTKMSTHRMYGLKYKAQMESAEFSGASGQNPSLTWDFVAGWFPLQASTVGINTVWNVEYSVEFFSRSQLAFASG